MTRIILISVMAAGLIGGGLYLDHASHAGDIDTSISFDHARDAKLTASPIEPSWILDGHPRAEAAKVAETSDGTTQLIVWRTSAGRFNWHYDFDETITVVDGDVFLTDKADASPGDAAERHLVPGSIVFFRKGSSATWRVPDHVSKVATIRHPLPEPVASLYRWARSAKSLLGTQAANAL